MKGWPAAAASLVSIALVFAAVDGAMRVVEALQTPIAEDGSTPYLVDGGKLGWAPLPGAVARVVKSQAERVLYDVVYAFDDHGRRIVPQKPTAAYRRHLLFFGDSNTFGEGVRARQTLAYRTVRRLPGVRAYNYAFRGYGPQHMLARLESTDLRAEIAEPRGLAVYVYHGFLLDRLIGGSATMRWVRALPYYRIEDGHVARDGFFQTTRPVYSMAMRAIGGSPLMRWLNLRWPLAVRDDDEEMFCRVVAASRDELRRQLPESDLLVVLHPKTPVTPYACFERYGIATVDIRQAYGRAPEERLRIPVDGHASPDAHELAGRALAGALAPLLAD